MTLGYRIICPTAKVSLSVGEKLGGTVKVGVYDDYITDSAKIPADAVYAARLDSDGTVEILLGKSGVYLPVIPHTFAGWPVPV